jgi:eukaryotic-like serine/threonine-protein kinase
MTDEIASRIERAFYAALAAREAGDAPDLSALCTGDPVLVAEVRSLLEHLDVAGSEDRQAVVVDDTAMRRRFLNPAELRDDRQAAVEGVRHGGMLDEWGASAVGQRVGDFTLLTPTGAGGMGIVFIAQQERPRRTVALKLVRRHVATTAMIRRFEREAHLLGRLNHAGIAQVYAAGVAALAADQGTPVRVPYIAMELIEGSTILEYVRAQPAANRTQVALSLVADACDAVQHAHQRGVIHRDLKPANVLVASVGRGQPQVKVLDFGVARVIADDGANVDGLAPTAITGHGDIVGTLAYMSPEQVRSGREVDARSDVYALGVILYQLLSDTLPIDVRDAPLPEAARRVAEHEPPRLGVIDRAFRGDVETIVATALQKDVTRR